MTRFALILGIGVFVALRVAAAAEEDVTRLEAARGLWQTTQVGNYRYDYQKFCECNRGVPPTTVVTVIDGRVNRIHHLHSDSDREVPAREGSLELYWTVDGLFDKLAGAYNREAVVRVEYDPSYGYPLSLFIDYDRDFAGDETDLRLIRFERL